MEKVTYKAVDFEEKSNAEVEKEMLEEAQGKENQENQEDKEEQEEESNQDNEEQEDSGSEEGQEDNDNNEAVVELNDESVLSFLKKRYEDDSIESFDDIRKTIEKTVEVEKERELSDEVENYLKYKAETGRGMNDYMKLNRDIDSIPDDALIAEYISAENPLLSPEEIEFKMKRSYGASEMDEEDDAMAKKIAKKEILSKAKNRLEEQKKKYGTPLGSSDGVLSPEDRKSFEDYKKNKQQQEARQEKSLERKNAFNKKTNDLFSKNFEGFGYKVGDETINLKVKDVEKAKDAQMDIMNFVKRHVDEDGILKDPAQYHKSLYAAMNPDEMAAFFYDLGKSHAIDDTAKDGKNIDMSPRKTGGKVNSKSKKFTAVKEDVPAGKLRITRS